jgi:phosphatidylinositol alpha-1,6-mannosyltransferase
MLLAGQRAVADLVVAGHILVLPIALAVAGRRPVATMVYGSDLWSPRAEWIVRRLGGRCERFVAISEFTRHETERLGVTRDRIRVANPGASVASVPEDWSTRLQRLGLRGDDGAAAPFVLTIARLAEPHKGQDVVIRALPAIVARHPGLRYVIAGEGPLRDHFRRIARASGIENSVVITGSVSEATKATLLKQCAALIMVSRESRTASAFEGFGLAFIEAALSRRPVIAGDSGAIPEVVRHGETGLLVDPRSPVATAEAVSLLLDDPGYAEALATAAHARAIREFEWPAAVDRLERIFGELAA